MVILWYSLVCYSVVIAQTNTHIQLVCVEVTANVITRHCGHSLKNMNFAKQNCAFSVTLEHGLPHVSHYNDFEIRPINLSDTKSMERERSGDLMLEIVRRTVF